jgi:TatD DNase family protein
MIPFIDIHTHHGLSTADVIAVRNWDYDAMPVGMSSIGVHPWQSVTVNTDMDFISKSMKEVEIKCRIPHVVMIGETGLDALRGADMNIQKQLFLRHIALSEQLGKPLIIHCVKAVEEMLSIRKQQHPTQQWIIHGYRKNAQLGKQLLQQGIALSFGPYFDAEAMKAAYEANALWLETDDSEENIMDVYQMASERLSISMEELKLNIYQRAVQLSSLFRLE